MSEHMTTQSEIDLMRANSDDATTLAVILAGLRDVPQETRVRKLCVSIMARSIQLIDFRACPHPPEAFSLVMTNGESKLVCRRCGADLVRDDVTADEMELPY